MLHSHPSGSDGSCGVYGTINNMWLYFLCVVSYQRLMRGDKTFFFFVNVTLQDRRCRALAQKLVRLFNLINADEESAFSFPSSEFREIPVRDLGNHIRDNESFSLFTLMWHMVF